MRKDYGVLYSTIGALVTGAAALFFTAHVVETDRKAKAAAFVAAHFNQVAPSPDPDGKLKKIFHSISRHNSAQAQFLVNKNIRLSMADTQEAPLVRVGQDAVTLNGKFNEYILRSGAALAIHYIQQKEARGQSYAETCFNPKWEDGDLLILKAPCVP